MSKVVVVTDSTAYIPEKLAAKSPIEVIPLQLIWGNETFRDGVDITPKEFYTRLENSKINPSTSQPSPAAFEEVYSRLLNEGYEILSVHISGKLSGTMDSAIQAKNMLPGKSIALVDSNSTTMALGFAALSSARAAADGATLEECRVIAEKARYHIGALFVVSTLEYLHRGGRIGGAAAFLGTALGLKPVLELREGRIEAIERVRTFSKAIDRLLELLEERVSGRTPLRLSTLNANAEEQAAELLERAKARFGSAVVVESGVAAVSPVIGTHAGPGTVGVAWMAGM